MTTESMTVDSYRCQLGIHCEGRGRIQVHIVQSDKLVCIKCVAGEERLTQQAVMKDLREGRDPNLIHRARSTNHKCS